MATRDFRHDNLIANTALPYVPNGSPVDVSRAYVEGSNVLTSYKGFAERRPGFAPYTADSYGATAKIRRWFTWQRWDGAFYVIICLVDATSPFSKVYKQRVGTDATFVLIDTDATSAEPYDFVIHTNYLFMGNGVRMKKYDGTTVTSWGFAGPTAAPAIANAAAGNVPSAIGHTYVSAYGVSATGYISDVSPKSVLTTVANRQWDVTVTGSSDASCDKIHVYRTEDGGATWRELSNSPMANGVGAQTIRDNDSDDTLQSTQAPLPYVNAVPVAGYGFTFFAGRIWWVDAATRDTVRWTGFEEVTNGFRPESAPRDNKRSFGKTVTGLSIAGPYLMVVAGDDIFRISGYSLATFTYETAHKLAGARNRAAITSDGDNMYWLDTSNGVRTSNGVQQSDLSAPMLSDISSIDHSQASLTIFVSGIRRWLVLSDGGAGVMRVFDMLTRRWQVPWPITGLQAVGAGETAAGTMRLFAGKIGKPLAMTDGAYLDDSVSYTAYAVIGLFSIVPAANPSVYGTLYYVGVLRDATALSDVKYLIDEDPTGATFTSIFANEKNPPGRTNHTNLIEKWYWTKLNTTGAHAAIRFDWAAANANFKLYAIDPAFRVGPGGVE